MAMAQITIVPLGTGSASLSEYVAAVVARLEALGVRHTLTPMGTVIEGAPGEILDIVKQIHEIPFALGAVRVSTSLTMDDRRDKPATPESKLASVRARLGEKGA